MAISKQVAKEMETIGGSDDVTDIDGPLHLINEREEGGTCSLK